MLEGDALSRTRRRDTQGVTEPDHGTVTRYKYRGCRCDPCRAANTADVRVQRLRRAEAEPPKHGESGYNNHGCRCGVCRAAVAAAARRRRATKAASRA